MGRRQYRVRECRVKSGPKIRWLRLSPPNMSLVLGHWTFTLLDRWSLLKRGREHRGCALSSGQREEVKSIFYTKNLVIESWPASADTHTHRHTPHLHTHVILFDGVDCRLSWGSAWTDSVWGSRVWWPDKLLLLLLPLLLSLSLTPLCDPSVHTALCELWTRSPLNELHSLSPRAAEGRRRYTTTTTVPWTDLCILWLCFDFVASGHNVPPPAPPPMLLFLLLLFLQIEVS